MLLEHRSELDGVDVVQVCLYVEEQGGDFRAGALEGTDLVGEGGNGVRRTEARGRAALVWVEEAGVPGKGHESDGQETSQDLGDSL